MFRTLLRSRVVFARAMLLLSYSQFQLEKWRGGILENTAETYWTLNALYVQESTLLGDSIVVIMRRYILRNIHKFESKALIPLSS